MSNTPFRPVRGTEANIAKLPIIDGYMYYAYDSGRVYMDRGNARIPMGGGGGSANGSSIYFGIYGKEIQEDAVTGLYHYPIESLEDSEASPRIDDIILDDAGALYRIKKIEEEYFACSLLPLSGSGGGPTIIRPALTLHDIENPIIINGQPFEISFTVKSALDENETPLTNKLTVYWSLIDADSEQVYYTGIPVSADHDVKTSLSVGSYLKESTDTIIELYATGINHDEPSVTRQASVSTVEMYLEQTSSYDPSYTYDAAGVTLYCNAVGSLSKILEWTFDGKVLSSQVLPANSTNPQSFAVPTEYTSHGYHTVEVNLYQNLGDATNPKKGLPATPLIYEIAVVKSGDSSQMPIIWLGDYQETYYNYDIIQIPFLVYNPANTASAEVRLYKNDIEIDGSPRTIKDFSQFSYWQIADAELNKENYYSIACGLTPETSAVREVKFKVVPDPNRDMTIVKQSNLKLNFDPAGRSNAEPATKRSSWTYGEGDNQIKATFENFNWYNNGWYTDSETKNTFLRISNGAKFTIPFGNLEFGTSDTSKQSNAIEIAFKVRNIQNYSNLITNITRYINDQDWFDAFEKQSIYTNYDAYLQATLTPEEYEGLEFQKVQKNINLKNAACGFYSGTDKSAVGIEVPNKKKCIVSMESILNSKAYQETTMELPCALGKTITNEVFMVDLAKAPHMLVAGATGMGKSVGLNAIVTSLLYKKHPSELKIVMVDPKKVEFSIYSPIENHFLARLEEEDEAIITDVQKVVKTLNSLCAMMDSRYDLLKKAKVRNIKEYNEKFKKRELNPENGHEFMPYIVVIIDEFGDLIMTAGKEIELPICRIAQLARAVGIHMIIATQRPTTNIITGTIKANFPARIAFRVAAMMDSRTILDRPGANQLIGRGDMLYLQGADPVRVQCAFVDTPEVSRICQYISQQQGYLHPMYLPEVLTEDAGLGNDNAADIKQLDPMFDEVAKLVVSTQQGSTSLIQRKFSIGYNRAGRLMDQLEKVGVVGSQQGSKPREVLIQDLLTLEGLLNTLH